MTCGRSKIVAWAEGQARRKAMVQVPEAPPMSSRCSELQRLHRPDHLVGIGRGDVMHRANECLLVARFAAHARYAFSGLAGLDDAAQLRPVAEAMPLMLRHSQDALRPIRASETHSGRPAGRSGCQTFRAAAAATRASRRMVRPRRSHSKSAGELRSPERRGSQRAEEVQVCRSGQDRRALVAAAQCQDFFSGPRLMGLAFIT